jgi:trk system potassium uptake protein TrkA
LDDTIVPARTISRYLADMAAGLDILELRTAIKDEARLFSFSATEEDAGDVKQLELPPASRVVWYYRRGKFCLAEDNTTLKAGDEVIVATHSANLEALRKRWKPKNANNS